MGPTRENLSSGFVNNTFADQPVHPRILISAFLVRVMENIISKLAAELAGFGLAWLETPKTELFVSRPNFNNTKEDTLLFLLFDVTSIPSVS